MANLIIEMPDDLARSLEGIADARRKSVKQLDLEQLSSLVAAIPKPRAGSPVTILQAMQAPTAEFRRRFPLIHRDLSSRYQRHGLPLDENDLWIARQPSY